MSSYFIITAIILVIILLFIVVFAMMNAGVIAGLVRRKALIDIQKSKHSGKPEYDLVLDLSPLEYELILFGGISRAGLIGALIQLNQHDVIELELNDNHAYVTLLPGINDKDISQSEKRFVTQQMMNGEKRFDLTGSEYKQQIKMLDYVTKVNLTSNSRLGAPSHISLVLNVALYATVSTAVLSGLVAVLTAAGGDYINDIANSLVLLSALMLPVLSTVKIMRRDYLQFSWFTEAISKQRSQLWSQLYGLHLYFKVSGPDIFQIESSRPSELGDELTPYYIASRFNDFTA